MNVALARALRQGVQLKDQRLYDLLGLMIDSLAKTDTDLVEVERRILATLGISTEEIADVTVFDYVLLPWYVKLSWEQVTGVSLYEIRKGTDWDTADFVTRTSTLSVLLDPIAAGTTRYLIKSMNSLGNYCTNAKSIDVIVTGPGQPSVTSSVIDNYGLIYWTIPTSDFEISYYELKKSGSLIGRITGTFTTIFESTGGTFHYTIQAFDVAGNAGTATSFDLIFGHPPDYVLEDQGVSSFGGTKTNCILWESALYAPLIIEEYHEHFDNNSWSTPQDQIDAGYPLYIQPTNITATYQEDFDFGTTISNIIANIIWTYDELDPTVTIVCKLKTSINGTDWSSETTANQIFAASLRYVRVKLEFTGNDDKALIRINSLTVNLNAKKETDSGSATANSGDTGGTIINFNKTFKDIESINVTVNETTPHYIVIDFTDAPDPTHFHVLVFDSSGTRQTKTVYWIAKGVI